MRDGLAMLGTPTKSSMTTQRYTVSKAVAAIDTVVGGHGRRCARTLCAAVWVCGVCVYALWTVLSVRTLLE